MSSLWAEASDLSLPVHSYLHHQDQWATEKQLEVFTRSQISTFTASQQSAHTRGPEASSAPWACREGLWGPPAPHWTLCLLLHGECAPTRAQKAFLQALLGAGLQGWAHPRDLVLASKPCGARSSHRELLPRAPCRPRRSGSVSWARSGQCASCRLAHPWPMMSLKTRPLRSPWRRLSQRCRFPAGVSTDSGPGSKLPRAAVSTAPQRVIPG